MRERERARERERPGSLQPLAGGRKVGGHLPLRHLCSGVVVVYPSVLRTRRHAHMHTCTRESMA